MQRRVHGGLRWEDGEMVNDDGKRTLLSNPTSSIPAGSHEGVMNSERDEGFWREWLES